MIIMKITYSSMIFNSGGINMGKLAFENATIGFDKAGLSKVLDDVRIEVIENAQKKMTDSFDLLIEKVDAAWQGQSAENFKKLMAYHKQTVSDAIGSCYGVLRAEMVEMMNAMSELDEQLVSFNGGAE